MDEANGEAVADLTALLPNDTAVLHMVVPGTNKRIGWDITMAGPGHPKTIALSNEATRERLHRDALIEQARVNGRKWKGEDKQAEESRREFIEGLVGRIVTWTPVKIGDEVVEFSEKAAIEFLLRPHLGPYVAQITDFLLEERSFMTDSART